MRSQARLITKKATDRTSLDFKAFNYYGCHTDPEGLRFRVFAPQAVSVSLVGEFNGWKPGVTPMTRNEEGTWELITDRIHLGELYKYAVEQTFRPGKTAVVLKTDPFGFYCEKCPGNASIAYDIEGYEWGDELYMKHRDSGHLHSRPMNIYEVHAGSFKRREDGSFLSWAELERELLPYVKSMGYTHLELMPIAEFLLDESWGYQINSYYAVTSRFGTPKDFMHFVDKCHSYGLGLIIDWVPAHFPKDTCGLYRFDGSSLYEYSDPLKSEQKDWGTVMFDYGKGTVVSFLVSNAVFFVEKYHIDGFRVDAVASILYLDFGGKPYIPNIQGGNLNLEAIAFLQTFNRAVHDADPKVITFAEESGSYEKTTLPVEKGGMGFDYKWNMGWMNDTLEYCAMDPIYRQNRHNALTFSLMYAFTSHYVLPLSHDECVHGKKSLINKTFGDYEQKFKGLRTMMLWMMLHPGKKLLFMGGEFAQFREWNYDDGLEFFMLDYEYHRRHRDYIRELNFMYLNRRELWEQDDSWDGFQWINCNDSTHNVVSLRRIAKDGREIVAIFNFSGAWNYGYSFGVPLPGTYHRLITTTECRFAGWSGEEYPERVLSIPNEADGFPQRLTLNLPPLSAAVYTTPPRRNKKIKEK